MSRKKFKVATTLISVLAFGAIASSTVVGMTACGQKEESTVLVGVTGVTIGNKDALQATPWYAGTTNRMVEISLTGSTENIGEAVADGKIEITSSDTAVVGVLGRYITPAGAGTATVTVTAHTDNGDVTDTVSVTVEKALEEPEATEVTVADILGMSFADWNNEVNQPIYQVTAKVGDFYGNDDGSYGPQDRPSSYGNFYVYDEENPDDQLLIYGASTTPGLSWAGGKWSYSNPQDFLDEEGNPQTKKGDTVTLKLMLAEYSGVIQCKGDILNIEEGVTVDYETITLSAEDTTLDINAYTTLRYEYTPDNVTVGGVTFEVTEGSDVVELVGNKVYGRKAGTATIIAKGGSVTSDPVTITVSSTEITYSSIESVYAQPNGSDVAFYGKFMGNFGSYGMFVGDGEYAIFLYGSTADEGIEVGDSLKISGTTSVYNGGFQIARGADILVDDKNRGTTPVEVSLETLDGIDGKDTGRTATVTGTVSEHALDKYENVTFKVTTASGAVIDCKADSRYHGEEVLAALGALKDGDTVSLKGNITFNVKGADTLPTTSEGLQLVNLSVVE